MPFHVQNQVDYLSRTPNVPYANYLHEHNSLIYTHIYKTNLTEMYPGCHNCFYVFQYCYT